MQIESPFSAEEAEALGQKFNINQEELSDTQLHQAIVDRLLIEHEMKCLISNTNTNSLGV